MQAGHNSSACSPFASCLAETRTFSLISLPSFADDRDHVTTRKAARQDTERIQKMLLMHGIQYSAVYRTKETIDRRTSRTCPVEPAPSSVRSQESNVRKWSSIFGEVG